MDNIKIAIIGSGGHAHVVASTLIALGYRIAGFYDDDEQKWGTSILGIPVVGSLEQLKSSNNFTHGIIAIGDNEARKEIAQRLDLEWITIVHPFSWVHPKAKLGKGTIICAGAIVQPGATIGSHVIINTKASVDHHTKVGDYSHIATSHLAGGASIGEGVFMALSSTVLPCLHVGDWSTVGAGALVTKNIEPGQTVVGSPARKIKSPLRTNDPK